MRDALRRAGFTVDHVGTADAAREMAAIAEYALVLLDLGLPDDDGLRLLPVLRDGGRVPVIVLAARDQLADRLAGLDGGADDYVVKPVEMPELVARCRAVLRRPGDRTATTLTLGALSLDTAAHSVTVDNVPVPLGRRKVSVLEQLMRAAGRVTSREVLEEAIYGFDDEVGPNALDAAIAEAQRSTMVTVQRIVERITEEDEFRLTDASGSLRVYVGPNWVPADVGETVTVDGFVDDDLFGPREIYARSLIRADGTVITFDHRYD